MDENVLVYYCYGNSSPLHITHNPIPAICSARKLSPNLPITVLYGADNANLFEPYAQQLKLNLVPFKTRSSHAFHQICYRPIDVLDYLKNSNYQRVIYSDSDVLWHTDPKKFVEKGDKSSSIWIADNYNTGVCVFTREAEPNFMTSWYGIATLMHMHHDHEIVRDLLTRHYNSITLHDESALQVLRALLRKNTPEIYHYPNRLTYIPGKEEATPIKYLGNDIMCIHYISEFTSKYMRREWCNEMWEKIGKVGMWLSITEYREAMESTLGTLLSKQFLRNLARLPIEYPVLTFVNNWRDYVQANI